MASYAPTLACTASAIPWPAVFGAEILDLSAKLVSNYSAQVSDQLHIGHPSSTVSGIDFCNITVTYTHPGQNDEIHVVTWLPTDTWNGNLQSLGGGGYSAGLNELSNTGMKGALGEGYAASSTDAGVGQESLPAESVYLLGPGNVNLYALQNLASVSLNDLAVISKDLINSFYGQPPAYSYWSGCSQGGRQGMMLAQRYPEAYDGILAAAPATDWAAFFPAVSWAQVFMNVNKQFPFPCELEAITQAAIAYCDPLDGVTDGQVSDPASCDFDPFYLVDQPIECSQTAKISHNAAVVANITWTGPTTPAGSVLFPGPYSQANITGTPGYANTTCTPEGACVGAPGGLGETWLQLFVKKDPEWTFLNISSLEEYRRLFHQSVQQYYSIIGTSDPDLTEFRNGGGKIIGFHGMADPLIPAKGVTDYYDRVADTTTNVHDFYRYFAVPGLAHCMGGNGGQPTGTFAALVDWVEKGRVPEMLPIAFNGTDGTAYKRILCPYPKKVVYKGGDLPVTDAASFECQ